MSFIGFPEASGNTRSAAGHTNATKSAGTETSRGSTAAPDGSPGTIAAVHRSLPFPTDDQLRWLLDQGIDGDAMTLPWPICAAWVRFDRDTFDFDLDGERGLIFRATDCGKVIDLIAWQPQTGKLASWRGVAFCLGDLDQIDNPATYFMGGALRVHASPLEWLRANREGIVILRRDFAYSHLRFCQRVICDDPAQAERVECWLRAPEPTVEIMIAEGAEREFA